jgi:lysyl-tRNA synthetase class 2
MSAEFKNRLQKRARALSLARSFFVERGLIEVDPLFLSPTASIDVAIDLFSTQSLHHEKRYLFSSPEYAMKRMLSQGSGDIFFLGHVWRDEPHSQKHSPEFLLAEWYREGFSFQQMMEETIEFAEAFLGPHPHLFLSYQQAFLKFAQLDPFASSKEELIDYCKTIPSFASYPVKESSKNDILNIILGTCVEPNFPKDRILALYHYPASQAALARHTKVNGNLVAERFELYYAGLELANGYHELAESSEQRNRFLADNQERVSLGKEAYPIDEKFLLSLSSLPDCCGVAVGVDRLLMIQEQAATIDQIIPIPWKEA